MLLHRFGFALATATTLLLVLSTLPLAAHAASAGVVPSPIDGNAAPPPNLGAGMSKVASLSMKAATGGATSPPVYEPGTVVATVGVGSGPDGVAYDGGNGDMYVANTLSDTVSVISGTTVVATVVVGTDPQGVAYDSGNGYVYVANTYSNNVSVISGTTVVASVGVGNEPFAVGYDRGNGYVYVANLNCSILPCGAGNVTVISGTTTVASVSVGSVPDGVAYDSGNGDMYVANSDSNSVSVISGTTVVATVGVGTNPGGVAYDSGNGDMYVANSGSNNVSVISGTTVVATVGVGSIPADVAYDRGNGYVYVANTNCSSTYCGGGSVSVISVTTVVATVGVGTDPVGVGYDDGNGDVYVTNSLSNSVSVIATILDVGTLGKGVAPPGLSLSTATFGVGSEPFAVGYDSGNGDMYVTNSGSNTVSVISGTTVVATVSVGSGPDGVAYDGGNGYVYVANSGSDTVSLISGTTVVATVGVGSAPEGVAYDDGNGYVYVVNSGPGTVSVISGTTVVATVSVGSAPRGVAYDGGNGYVYVANFGSDTVSLISGTTVVATVSVGSGPDGVAYDGGNGYVYVTDHSASTVSVISGTTVVATVGVGSLPSGVAHDRGNGDMYVANTLSDTVSVISGTTVVATVSVGSEPFGVGYDGGNGDVYVPNYGTSNVSVLATSWASGFAPTLTIDVEQNLFLIAPLVFLNPGVTGVSATTSSTSGLDCTALSATLTNVSMGCTAMAPGVYTATLTVTGTLGNSVWTSATVTVSSDPVVSVPSPTRQAADVGQTILFSTLASGGPGTYVAYAWSAPSALGCVNSTSNTLSCVPTAPIVAGTVSVNVTDGNNMTSLTASRAYNVSADPTISAPSATRSTLDVGQSTVLSVTATNGTGLPSVYTWQGLPPSCPSVNAPSIRCAPTVAGTYIVSASIEDSNGLTVSSGSLVLVVSPPLGTPTLAGSASALDVGQSVTFVASVSGGEAPYAYVWEGLPSGCASVDAATVTCSPTGAGVSTVAVTVTDANGVVGSSASLHLTVSAEPTISALTASRMTLDVGQSTVLNVTATNGTGLRSVYAWSGLPAGCASVDVETLTCAPTAPGTYTVTVAITDSNGYTVTSGPVLLVVSLALTAPTLSASVRSVDVGQAVTFAASVSGGEAPYTYVWEGLPSGCASVDAATVTCSPTGAGVSTVAVTVTDANGVVGSSASFDLTVSPRLVGGSLSLTPAVIDLGQGIEINVTVSGGSAGLTYAWSGLPSGCAGTGAKVDCTPGAAGTSWISVEVTDGNGEAVRVGPTPLTVNPALGAVTVSESTSSLELGGSVAFTASVTGGTGPLAYSWSGLPSGCASVNSPVVLCVPAQTGRYAVSVKVTDGTGASVTATGAPVSVSGAPSPGSGSGTNGLEWAVLGLALVALVIGGVALVLLLRKDRRAPPGVGTGDTRSAGEPVPKEPEVGKGEVGEGDKE